MPTWAKGQPASSYTLPPHTVKMLEQIAPLLTEHFESDEDKVRLTLTRSLPSPLTLPSADRATLGARWTGPASPVPCTLYLVALRGRWP